jgi:hypothetical protein
MLLQRPSRRTQLGMYLAAAIAEARAVLIRDNYVVLSGCHLRLGAEAAQWKPGPSSSLAFRHFGSR